MIRIFTLALIGAGFLAACSTPNAVTGRADNDVLRFSAKSYDASGIAAR